MCTCEQQWGFPDAMRVPPKDAHKGKKQVGPLTENPQIASRYIGLTALLPRRNNGDDSKMTTSNIAVVDDDDGFRRIVRKLLHARGFNVVVDAADGVSGLAAITRQAPEYALIDVYLPDVDGIELARRVLRRLPHLKVLLTSTDSDIGWAIEENNTNIAFIAKDEIACCVLGDLFRTR